MTYTILIAIIRLFYLIFSTFLTSFYVQASDVLAVELLQKDARLAVAGEQGRPCVGGM